MSIVRRTYEQIDRGRSNIVHGVQTKIPKYDEFLDGTTWGKIYLYGAETAVGKTAFIRDKHMHTVYEEYKRINDTNRLDVLFIDFSLEITPVISMAGAISRKFFMDYDKVVPYRKILKGLGDEDKRIADGMREYFEDFERKLLVFDDDITPNRFHDVLMDIAKANGTFSREAPFISGCGTWTPNNPNKLIVVTVDTINLAEMDSGHTTIKSTIDRISRICVYFRNKCNFFFAIAQQFNAEISAVDRSRYGIKTPLLRDFEDSKRTVKDADVVFGLYDPMRHMKEEETVFRGYDISILKSWFRSLHILKNREGESQKFIPLKFDGAVGIFTQLPDAMTQQDYIVATRH